MPELRDVRAAGRRVAVELNRARVRSLHEVLPEALHPLDPGVDLSSADELDVDVRNPPHALVRKQRLEAIVVTHHQRVDELAAQRLDLDAIRDGPKVACASRPAGLVRCLDRPHCSSPRSSVDFPDSSFRNRAAAQTGLQAGRW
jgi:hypothetical protein